LNTTFRDPYRNFKSSHVDGNYVAVEQVHALKTQHRGVDWHEGGDPLPYKLPGKTKFEPITLEAGVTHDTRSRVATWSTTTQDGIQALKDFRKDVLIIDVFNLQDK